MFSFSQLRHVDPNATVRQPPAPLGQEPFDFLALDVFGYEWVPADLAILLVEELHAVRIERIVAQLYDDATTVLSLGIKALIAETVFPLALLRHETTLPFLVPALDEPVPDHGAAGKAAQRVVDAAGGLGGRLFVVACCGLRRIGASMPNGPTAR